MRLERAISILAAAVPPRQGATKKRQCLGCGRQFRSRGIGHRICKRCSQKHEKAGRYSALRGLLKEETHEGSRDEGG